MKKGREELLGIKIGREEERIVGIGLIEDTTDIVETVTVLMIDIQKQNSLLAQITKKQQTLLRKLTNSKSWMTKTKTMILLPWM